MYLPSQRSAAGWPLPSLVVALLALSATALQGQTPPGAPLPAVVVAEAQRVELAQTATFTGRLVATQKVDLIPRVSGFVEEIGFTEGRRVAAGDVLFVIEDEAYRAAVAETEGLIDSAEAELRLAELERDRTATLVDRDTVSQAELDRAEAVVGQSEGNVARLEAQLSRAELDLSYTQITAPFEGIAGLSQVDVGALVTPQSGPLVTLTSLDPIFVEFSVSTGLLLEFRRAVQAGEIEPEGLISLILPDGTTYDRDGTVDFIDAEVAQGTDTILLRAVFENPDTELPDGALVNVLLSQSTPEPRLAIPAQAVQRDLAGAFAMVVAEGDVVEQRRIDVGDTAQGLTAILSGLEEGERVITDGVNKVRPGIQVDAALAGDG